MTNVDEVTEMTFTGQNGAEVRDWVDGETPFGESWFFTRGMSASTSGQAWNSARAGRTWPQKVKGTVYDPRTGEWHPVRAGDVVVREGGGYSVRTPR